MPTLETPTGGVWESNAIARYVARLSDKGLFGASAFEEVRAWLSLGNKLRTQHLQCVRACYSAEWFWRLSLWHLTIYKIVQRSPRPAVERDENAARSDQPCDNCLGAGPVRRK